MVVCLPREHPQLSSLWNRIHAVVDRSRALGFSIIGATGIQNMHAVLMCNLCIHCPYSEVIYNRTLYKYLAINRVLLVVTLTSRSALSCTSSVKRFAGDVCRRGSGSSRLSASMAPEPLTALSEFRLTASPARPSCTLYEPGPGFSTPTCPRLKSRFEVRLPKCTPLYLRVVRVVLYKGTVHVSVYGFVRMWPALLREKSEN